MSTWIDFTRRNDPANVECVEILEYRLSATKPLPDVLCFWTKAPSVIADLYRAHIKKMQDDNILVLAQVTYTGYDKILEPGVPEFDLSPLVDLLGSDCIRLRFDPIIPGYTTAKHLRKVVSIAQDHNIKRIITNFIVPEYKNCGAALSSTGVNIIAASKKAKRVLLKTMVSIISERNIELQGCAEIFRDGIAPEGMIVAGCSDSEWATSLWPELKFSKRPSRPGCLCCYSKDWGQYQKPECQHKCIYCYASKSADIFKKD